MKLLLLAMTIGFGQVITESNYNSWSANKEKSIFLEH